MTRSRLLVGLAVVGAFVCVSTGIVYTVWAGRYARDDGFEFLAGVAYLGAGALAAVGLWQDKAVSRTRIILLLVLAGLAAGYAAANILALSISPVFEDASVGPPRELHFAGLALGTLLYVGALIETTFAIRDERRASSRA